MRHSEQRRVWVLTRVLGGELTVAEAAELLGLSERSIHRLRAQLQRDGPAGLVHGNRGRVSPRRLGEATRARILGLAKEEYAGCNDSHLADLLAEREGITIARSSLQRLLRAEGRPSTRRRRAPKHRSRRDRMPREGLLLQTDGSRHDWLEDRGPWLTLVGYIDDATGRVTGATFRDQEDSAGYLEALAGHAPPLRRAWRRLPRPPHHLRAGRVGAAHARGAARRQPRTDAAGPHLRGARHRLGQGPQSPGQGPHRAALGHAPGPARGRAADRWHRRPRRGQRLSARLPRAAQPPLHRPRRGSRAGLGTATARHPARADLLLQVPAHRGPRWHGAGRGHDRCSCRPRPNGRSRAGQKVELHVRLDGRLVVWDGQRELVTTPAPLDAVQLRALAHARVEVGEMPRSAATATKVRPDHPWRRVRPGTKLHARINAERDGVTEFTEQLAGQDH